MFHVKHFCLKTILLALFENNLCTEVPIEDTGGAMSALVKAGKIKYISNNIAPIPGTKRLKYLKVNNYGTA